MGLKNYYPGFETCFAQSNREAGWDAKHISNHDCKAIFFKRVERWYTCLHCTLPLPIALHTLSRFIFASAIAAYHPQFHPILLYQLVIKYVLLKRNSQPLLSVLKHCDAFTLYLELISIHAAVGTRGGTRGAYYNNQIE